MKKTIIAILLLATITGYSQDSTKVLNFQATVNVTSFMSNYFSLNDSTDAAVLFDIRKSWVTAGRPTNGGTTLTIDSMKVIDLVNIYEQCHNSSFGRSQTFYTLYKLALVAPRAANSNLNRQCTAIEDKWQEAAQNLLQMGKRRLTQRN